MHPVLRHAVLVGALIGLAVIMLQRTAAGGAPLPAQRGFVPFPAALVAQAPALPQYADGATTRVRQQLASVDAMWEKAFLAAGDRYERAELVDAGAAACRPDASWAGLYCVETEQIVIDVPGHLQRNAAVGGGLSDTVLGYIVAHEAGHHVQVQRGAPTDRSGDSVLRSELHADCLAGVWGKAAGLPLPPTWMYGSDAEHGTATQRIQWLNVGYRGARPADCDAIWDGSTSP
ncbi:MAG TPA: neutral zinc metallopeptidase [Solirubrobacteraceae bacterium]|nr:neutral zinc metallopeptidase [Solirubrobacteraceae bacterium]